MASKVVICVPNHARKGKVLQNKFTSNRLNTTFAKIVFREHSKVFNEYIVANLLFLTTGKDYNHQQLNPNSECQWCDLYDKTSKSSSVWTNKPAVSCNDGNDCTKQDLCNNGRCVGKAYSCRSSYPQSSCIQRSECVGDGTCRDVMRTKGTICRPVADKCDQPER